MLEILAARMKVFRIDCLANTLIRGDDRAKQADRAWLPNPRSQEGLFPTGYSQTAAKLERDIKWWLNEANGCWMNENGYYD